MLVTVVNTVPPLPSGRYRFLIGSPSDQSSVLGYQAGWLGSQVKGLLVHQHFGRDGEGHVAAAFDDLAEAGVDALARRLGRGPGLR